MMIKNPTSCLAVGPKENSVFTIPMCFKGAMGSKNKEMFQRHQVENPDEVLYDKHHKTHDHLNLCLMRNHFLNCECWLLHYGHMASIAKLMFNVKTILMPSETKCNVVTLLRSSPLASTKQVSDER